jgi:hypothetical protein
MRIAVDEAKTDLDNATADLHRLQAEAVACAASTTGCPDTL